MEIEINKYLSERMARGGGCKQIDVGKEGEKIRKLAPLLHFFQVNCTPH